MSEEEEEINVSKSENLSTFLFYSFAVILYLLVIAIVACVIEFWFRYGESIDCIYYLVKNSCSNYGNPDDNGKLSLLEYIFPTNTNSYPYEFCRNKKQSGGSTKEGKIASNYIQNYNNGSSKCITLDTDFTDFQDKKSFPYNIGDFANKEMKNAKLISMPFKGFSFFFLYTVLFTRLFLKFILKKLSKFYQKKYTPLVSTLFFIVLMSVGWQIFFTTILGLTSAFYIIGFFYGLICDIGRRYEKTNKLFDYFKNCESNNIFPDNPLEYYKIFYYKEIFASILPQKIELDTNGKNYTDNVALCFILFLIGLGISLGISQNFGNIPKTVTILSFSIILPLIGYAINYKMKLNQSIPIDISKFFIIAKRVIKNLLMFIPLFIIYIITFCTGLVGSLLASFYMSISVIFNIFSISLTNPLEFLDILTSHSTLLKMIFLVSVVGSSAKTLKDQVVSGILGGLFAIYFLYQVIKFFYRKQ